ncbi:MAG: UPF0261 family protein [Anaerolineales bacterium]|nr:MAG: UPF0261 family protein [Anaerolineales bacterium]
MSKTIAIVCTLDTKGEEARYLKELIEARGHKTILIDTNMGGEPTITPDISAEEVARLGGGDIREIQASKKTGEVTPIMIKGASVKVKELLEGGQLDGIISFGGASNTTVGTSVMKTLPFGIPKFMVSSMASVPAYAAKYIGTKDITMMHSVVDIAGFNDLTKAVLERAAGGICGMVEASTGAIEITTTKPIIAITEFKFAEGCSHHVREYLEEKGYEVIPWHAQGVGDRTMEDLIEQGLFDGVIDLVPAGVSEQLIGGNRAAGPTRLEAAGARGIPQVVAPCGFDMISCGPLDRRDKGDPLWTSHQLAERKSFIPDAFRVQVRTSADELRETAQAVAEKLNKSKGPVKFLIPTKGWSALSVEGADLHEPETDAVFAPALREHLTLRRGSGQGPDIEVKELDTHLNTPEFARAVVEALEEMMKK